jgi:hypothetical protein
MKTAMDYENEERETMTPPLCPMCHRRGSERVGMVALDIPDAGYGGAGYRRHMGKFISSLPCPSSFHDAADYGSMLLEAARAYCELTVCYRINQTPSEALFARLGKAKKVLAAVEGRIEEEKILDKDGDK